VVRQVRGDNLQVLKVKKEEQAEAAAAALVEDKVESIKRDYSNSFELRWKEDEKQRSKD
jgi:hypothetical protein